jgi:hypothetical protein
LRFAARSTISPRSRATLSIGTPVLPGWPLCKSVTKGRSRRVCSDSDNGELAC